MQLASEEVTISQWGNSKALRLPVTLSNLLDFNVSDRVDLIVEVDSATGEKRLIVDKLDSTPQSIKELFKDYDEGAFQAQIQEFEPVGSELW